MKISLYATSDYTTTFLTKPTIAKIHSIYAKTINLTIFNQILALQPKGAYLNPLSLITHCSDKEFQQIAPQFEALQGQEFSIEFELSACKIYSSRLLNCGVNFDFFERYTFQSKQILLQSDKKGLRNVILHQRADDFIFQAMLNILQQAQADFTQGKLDQFAQGLAKLIGLGIGLTPSGDDFLCGVLAVLHKIGTQGTDKSAVKNTAVFTALRQAIEPKLNQTNEISRAFLVCALENHFSQAIINFFEPSHEISQTDLFQQFDQIGHSSGIDTVCGVYFMLRLLE